MKIKNNFFRKLKEKRKYILYKKTTPYINFDIRGKANQKEL